MAEIPSHGTEGKIRGIVYFCRGSDPESPKRCDHFIENQVCPVAGLAQRFKAYLDYCDLAQRDGVPGNLDEIGFHSHPERAKTT